MDAGLEGLGGVRSFEGFRLSCFAGCVLGCNIAGVFRIARVSVVWRI